MLLLGPAGLGRVLLDLVVLQDPNPSPWGQMLRAVFGGGMSRIPSRCIPPKPGGEGEWVQHPGGVRGGMSHSAWPESWEEGAEGGQELLRAGVGAPGLRCCGSQVKPCQAALNRGEGLPGRGEPSPELGKGPGPG